MCVNENFDVKTTAEVDSTSYALNSRLGTSWEQDFMLLQSADVFFEGAKVIFAH